jgi:hypothetical protein
MKALIHIVMTGLLLPCFGLAFYYGLGGASGRPSIVLFFGGFVLLPSLGLFIWPWLLASVLGSAAVCSLVSWASFRRLSTWFLGAMLVGAAFGAIIGTVMHLPRPWLAAIAGSLAAAIGAYPLRDVWASAGPREA